MRKYIILFFLGMLLLLSCKKAPEGIIKPDVMANLLTEVHLADGSMLNIPQVPDSIYKYGMGKYLEIFKKYHTDSAQFRKSFKYYTIHPDEMVAIYDVVLKKLTAKSDSVTALIAKNNTSQFNKNGAGKAVGGKYAPTGSKQPQPTRPVPGGPAQPSLQAKPGVPPSGPLIKEQIKQRLRMRMRQDSIMKKHSKKAHVVPV